MFYESPDTPKLELEAHNKKSVVGYASSVATIAMQETVLPTQKRNAVTRRKNDKRHFAPGRTLEETLW